MYKFVVHLNDIPYIKRWCLGLDPVSYQWYLVHPKNVISPHQENHFSKNNPDSTHHLCYSLYVHILTSSDPTFPRGPVVGKLHYVRISYQSPTWSDSPPTKISVECDIIQPPFSLLFEIIEAISLSNLWRILNISVFNLA